MASGANADPLEDAATAYQRHDYATAFQIWQPLADKGDVNMQNMLGYMSAKGQGVPQDYSEAMKWWRLAGDQGDAEAQNNLGSAYQAGWGVPENDAEAAVWYRKAADQGIANAQYNLGVFYANGHGVSQATARRLNGIARRRIRGSRWRRPISA